MAIFTVAWRDRACMFGPRLLMQPSLYTRFLFLLAIFTSLAGSAFAAKAKWTRVEAPNFSMLIETSDLVEARNAGVDFELFRRSMQQVLPISPTRMLPATIVIFKDEDSMRAFTPRVNGHVAELAGFYVNLPTQMVAVTRFGAENDQVKQSLYWGGTQWFLRGFERKFPDWFTAGFGELFKTFEIKGENFRIGKASEVNVRVLHQIELVPLDQIFGLQMDTLAFGGVTDERTQRFFAESWLFLHYCMFGRDSWKDKTGRAGKLDAWLKALEQGATPQEACHDVFGTDFEGLKKEMSHYLSGGRYAISGGKFSRENLADDIKVTPMSEAEIEMARGFAALGLRDFGRARGHFGHATMLDTNNPAFYTALGEVARLENNPDEAIVQFQRATDLGSRDYRAWWFPAEHFITQQTRNRNGILEFEPGAARKFANQLERSINLNPYYITSYERLALLVPSIRTTGDADRQFLELGLKFSPNSQLLQAGMGAWEMKNNQVDAGRARLQRCLDSESPDLQAKAIAENLLSTDAIGGKEETVRQFIAAGKVTEAGELLDKLIRDPHSASRREALSAQRSLVGQMEILQRVEELLAEKSFTLAEALVQGVIDAHSTPELTQRGEALLARAKAKQ